MIDRRTYLEHYWNPRMLSEREFLEIADYVALRKSNYQIYSEKLDGDTLFDRSCRITVGRGYESIELAPFAEMTKEKAPEW